MQPIDTPKKYIRSFAIIALMLAFMVVMLGAYTRLTNAGLGCPDWPGCYGHLVLPKQSKALESIQSQYPGSPIETTKAWTEMVHRYAAGLLGMLLVCIALSSLVAKWRGEAVKLGLPFALLGLVLLQAALGMWTVTLKLLPVVVMGHLLGGMLIVACLSYYCLQSSNVQACNLPRRWRYFCALGILLVFCQIALGGWVSANYAGIACIGFPQCNGQWWPALHWMSAFNLLSPLGANYQGGLLDNEMRISIQFIHRLGAVLTASYVILLSLLMMSRQQHKRLSRISLLALLLVIIQCSLGIANVIYMLPLEVAVAHNGVAALLLAVLVLAFYVAQKESTSS